MRTVLETMVRTQSTIDDPLLEKIPLAILISTIANTEDCGQRKIIDFHIPLQNPKIPLRIQHTERIGVELSSLPLVADPMLTG